MSYFSSCIIYILEYHVTKMINLIDKQKQEELKPRGITETSMLVPKRENMINIREKVKQKYDRLKCRFKILETIAIW